jgi:hypothetical protein
MALVKRGKHWYGDARTDIRTSAQRTNKAKRYRMQIEEAERQARQAAAQYMYGLALHRDLPHALEEYHVTALRNGASPPYGPGEVRYMPLEAVVIADDEPLPAAFVNAGITREASRSLILKQQDKDQALWQSEFPDRPYDRAPMFHAVLDGKAYPVVLLDKEAGIKRDKIVGMQLKPLGYKGRAYCYTKKLTEVETMTCEFDFGTWRGSLDAALIYKRRLPDMPRDFTLRLPLIAWPVGKQEHADGISVANIPHTTERNLLRTAENMAFLATKLEQDLVPQWRQLAAQVA